MESPNGVPHCTLKPTSICNVTVLILKKEMGEWKCWWKWLENFWFKLWYPAYLKDPSTAAILKPSRSSWSCSHPSSPRQLPRLTGEGVDLTDAHKFAFEDFAIDSCLSLISQIEQLSIISTQHLRGSNAAFSYQNQTVVKQISAALHGGLVCLQPLLFQSVFLLVLTQLLFSVILKQGHMAQYHWNAVAQGTNRYPRYELVKDLPLFCRDGHRGFCLQIWNIQDRNEQLKKFYWKQVQVSV